MFPFFRHKLRPPLTPTNFLALIGASETTINSLDEAGVLSLITKRFDRDYKSRRLPWSQSEIATELAIIMNHLNNIAARPDLTLLLEATIGDKMRHTTVITMMKCYALWRSGDLPGLEKNVLDAITRTQVEPNFSSTIGSFIRASVNILPPRPQYHRYIWGEHRRSLEDWLTQSVSRPTTESLSTNLKQNLIEIRHEKTEDLKKFNQAIEWGNEVSQYIRFVSIAAHNASATSGKGYGTFADNEGIARLSKSIPAVLHHVRSDDLDAAVERGRSIVVVAAHAGFWVSAPLLAQRLGLPGTVISRTAGARQTDRNFNIGTLSANANLLILKLIKMMKRQQRIVYVVSDGTDGETCELSLLGKPVKIGKGAALIAHHGRAVIFFQRTYLVDQRIHIEYVRGPDGSLAKNGQEFEEEFLEFYIGELQKIILGNPENMAPGAGAGFWSNFISRPVDTNFLKPPRKPGFWRKLIARRNRI